MKRAFSTLGCLNADTEQVIGYALFSNMNGVEPRVNEKGETFGGKTISDAEEIRSRFKKANLTITDLAISCSLREYDEKQIEYGKNGIDFASALGAKGIRVFAGAHQNLFTDRDETDREGMKKALLRLSDYGREKDVDILLETHSSFSSGKRMRELLCELNRDNINVIWDVLHSLEYHETPEETVGFLGEKIVHVHLKDGHPAENSAVTQFVHTDLGKGTVSAADAAAALKKIGYNGFLSLEWESPWRPEIRELYSDFNDLLSAYNRFLDNAGDLTVL